VSSSIKGMIIEKNVETVLFNEKFPIPILKELPN